MALPSSVILRWSICLVVWYGVFMSLCPSAKPTSGSGVFFQRRFFVIFKLCLKTISRTQLVNILLRIQAWKTVCILLSKRLYSLDFHLDKEEVCSLLISSAFILGVVLAVLRADILLICLPVLVMHILILVFSASSSRRLAKQLQSDMPDVFRTLSLSLSSGKTLAQSIDYVGANSKGFLAESFTRTSMRLRCGSSLAEALTYLEEELGEKHIALLTTALLISQRTGSPLCALLETSAQLVESQHEMQRLLSVKTAQVRLSVKIVCFLPLAMIALLALVSVDFQRGLFTRPGLISIFVAVLMDAGALLIIRRLMKGVL